MDHRKFILEEKSINKLIFKMAWPMILAFLIQTSFNIVDGVFVGMISTNALAAISIFFPVLILMFALAAGLGVGANSLIARSVGAKHFNKANDVAKQSVFLAIIVSLILTTFGLFFGRSIFSLITQDTEILSLVIQYSNIIFAGSVFMFLGFVASHILRGEGNMKIPMYALGGAAILNIILDPIFIFTFGLGVKGAAYATVVSRVISVIFIYSYILSGKSVIKLIFDKLSLDFKIIKEIFYVGISSSISQMSASISLFLITMILSTFGPAAIAAFGIVVRLEGLIFMPVIGMMTAMITITGQNFGAGKIRRARKCTFNAAMMTMSFGIFVGVVFLLFSRNLSLMFNKNPEVINLAVSFFNINFWVYPFLGILFVILGSFLGVGKPIPPLIINMLRLLIIYLPLAWFLSSFMGVIGVWIASAVSMSVSGIVGIIWFWIVDFKKN